MKKHLKVLSLLLAMVFAATVFTACEEDSDDETEKNTEPVKQVITLYGKVVDAYTRRGIAKPQIWAKVRNEWIRAEGYDSTLGKAFVDGKVAPEDRTGDFLLGTFEVDAKSITIKVEGPSESSYLPKVYKVLFDCSSPACFNGDLGIIELEKGIAATINIKAADTGAAISKATVYRNIVSGVINGTSTMDPSALVEVFASESSGEEAVAGQYTINIPVDGSTSLTVSPVDTSTEADGILDYSGTSISVDKNSLIQTVYLAPFNRDNEATAEVTINIFDATSGAAPLNGDGTEIVAEIWRNFSAGIDIYAAKQEAAGQYSLVVPVGTSTTVEIAGIDKDGDNVDDLMGLATLTVDPRYALTYNVTLSPYLPTATATLYVVDDQNGSDIADAEGNVIDMGKNIYINVGSQKIYATQDAEDGNKYTIAMNGNTPTTIFIDSIDVDKDGVFDYYGSSAMINNAKQANTSTVIALTEIKNATGVSVLATNFKKEPADGTVFSAINASDPIMVFFNVPVDVVSGSVALTYTDVNGKKAVVNVTANVSGNMLTITPDSSLGEGLDYTLDATVQQNWDSNGFDDENQSLAALLTGYGVGNVIYVSKADGIEADSPSIVADNGVDCTGGVDDTGAICSQQSTLSVTLPENVWGTITVLKDWVPDPNGFTAMFTAKSKTVSFIGNYVADDITVFANTFSVGSKIKCSGNSQTPDFKAFEIDALPKNLADVDNDGNGDDFTLTLKAAPTMAKNGVATDTDADGVMDTYTLLDIDGDGTADNYSCSLQVYKSVAYNLSPVAFDTDAGDGAVFVFPTDLSFPLGNYSSSGGTYADGDSIDLNVDLYDAEGNNFSGNITVSVQ